MVRADVAGGLEPEHRHLGQHPPLVGDRGGQDDVVGRDPVRGDHQQVVLDLVHLAHLARGMESQIGERVRHRSAMLTKIADLRGIDSHRASALAEAENARFVDERPRSMELGGRAAGSMPRGVPMAWMDDLYEHPPVWVAAGEGAYFTDVDGHTYLDMYVADMSAFCGHAPAAGHRGGRRPDGAGGAVPPSLGGRDRGRRAPRRAATGSRSGSSRCRRPRRTPR